MGVWGLTGLIESNSRIYWDLPFRGGRLVIDGCNLLYVLYFSSGLDQNLGGEYAAFEELVENFFTALRTCSISPFVVLDGGQDVSGKKIQTLTKRMKDRIQKAHQAAVEGSQENVLPPLASLVFKQTLVQLKVPMVVCYEEADREIAALAIEWNCPVLSADSDFYIFDVPAGMLPLSHFQWRTLEQRGSQRFIPCKKYSTSNFCTFFGIQKELLPTFAVLAGNDYVKLKTPDWTELPPACVKKSRRLWGLLYWLKRFNVPEEAVEATLKLMTGNNTEQQQTMRESLYRGIREYQLPSSSLKKFFIHGIPPPFPEAVRVVPEWIQSCLARGEMTPDILDVLRLQSRSLQVCVGSAELPSAHETSKPLRQVMYGLLVPHRRVQEKDRVGIDVKEIDVQSVINVTLEDLPLLALPKVEHSRRLQALLEVLDVNEATLSLLPSELHLPVAVTCYWWQKARPIPDVRLLKALLLGLSIGASHSPEAVLYHVLYQAWTRRQERLVDFLVELARELASSHVSAKKAGKEQSLGQQSPTSSPGKRVMCQRTEFDLNLSMAHNVIQWQSCLKECIYLNQLLCHPLAQPHISRLYKGTLVHHLIQRMMSGKLKNFLKKDLSRVNKYKTMLAAVRQFDSQQPRRRRAFHQGHQPRVKEIVVDVWRLYDRQEEAAAVRALKDIHLEHMVSLKVRHTAKDKRKSTSNLMMVCKSERRGKDLI